MGQNLAWGSYKMTWTEAIKLWSDEKKDFVYGQESAGVVGHYTQVIFRTFIKEEYSEYHNLIGECPQLSNTKSRFPNSVSVVI